MSVAVDSSPSPNGTIWTARGKDNRARYDDWVYHAQQFYGLMHFGASASDEFHANAQVRDVGNLTLIACQCSPCEGWSSRRSISQADRQSMLVQLVLEGEEIVTYDDTELVLKPGDILIGDSVRPSKWKVTSPLRKLSIIASLDRFRDLRPTTWQNARQKVSGKSGAGRLLWDFVVGLADEADNIQPDTQDAAISECALSLMASLAPSEQIGPSRSARTEALKAYVEKHLNDEELSISSLAEANGISVRYAHALFQNGGLTYQDYLIRRRLERCFSDLKNPAMSHTTITQIAMNWGFKSLSHFSRRFRDQYGVSPRSVRHQPPVVRTGLAPIAYPPLTSARELT